MIATWTRWSQHPLFVHFIERFRNRVVKEYRSDVSYAHIAEIESGHRRVEFTVSDGFFAGRNVVALMAAAIEWWEAYIDVLDARIASEQPEPA